MRNNSLRAPDLDQERAYATVNGQPSTPMPERGFEPQSVHPSHSGAKAKPAILRMYTENEVAEILQVSLSQLRKWRMTSNRDKGVGPPFKKIGRLVRYPEQGLQDYINGK